MEFRRQALDRSGVFDRTTSGPGVPDRILSSCENLRASVGLEANENAVIIISVPLGSLRFWVGNPSENLSGPKIVEDHAKLATYACSSTQLDIFLILTAFGLR